MRLLRVADDVWWTLDEPTIGSRRSRIIRALAEREARSPQAERAASWSAGEQAGVATAAANARSELAAINDAYEARFGYIYIVCAAGKSADELLDIARTRLTNERDVELRVAAEEQRKITQSPIEKAHHGRRMSTLSTHVLDTSLGRPASGVRVQSRASWSRGIRSRSGQG